MLYGFFFGVMASLFFFLGFSACSKWVKTGEIPGDVGTRRSPARLSGLIMLILAGGLFFAFQSFVFFSMGFSHFRVIGKDHHQPSLTLEEARIRIQTEQGKSCMRKCLASYSRCGWFCDTFTCSNNEIWEGCNPFPQERCQYDCNEILRECYSTCE